MSRHKMFAQAQRDVAARMENAVPAEEVRQTYREDLGAGHPNLPLLVDASRERQVENLKSIQAPVWHLARETYAPNLAHTVYVGWMFGEPDDWAGTADAYSPGRYINPVNTALLYVGFTGQPDFLKPSVPELLAVLVPLKLEEGNLVGDGENAVVRSVSCAARGLGSAPAAPYSRQFNYTTERRFMHSAYCAAVQYCTALQGKFDYANRCMGMIGSGLTLPSPQLCLMIRSGVNRNGVRSAPRPVPLGQLRDDQFDAEAFKVLDIETVPPGIDLTGPELKLVRQTLTWRLLAGHVRALFHRYGESVDGSSDFRPTIDVCVSVR